MRVDIDDGLIDAASKVWIATGWIVMIGAIVIASCDLLMLVYSTLFA